MFNTKEIGIYIHIPFCKSKCYYCDFNSYTKKDYLIPEYCKALINEIQLYSSRLKKLCGKRIKTNSSNTLNGVNVLELEDIVCGNTEIKVKSIYIGGGTPSLLPLSYICRIIDECMKCYNILEDAEITIEANPGTVTREKLKAYKKAGINRLSIGLQAWQNRLLKDMGRIHTAEEFVDNLCMAREVGFANISADLIFGLPGQKLDEWEETLERVTCEGIEHLSCYDLKIEEGTVLGNKVKEGQVQPIEDELDRDMYHMTIKKLKNKGFKHYEISNFSKPGFESKHNMIYWKTGEYIGLGAGAYSYFNSKRYNNVEKPENYVYNISVGKSVVENIQTINEADKISEYLILGLRLIDGISMKEFKDKFDKELLELYRRNIDILIRRGLLCFSEERIKLTSLGLDLANQVFVEFI
ncbi:MAG TPA: radical SAM family heme chaperone HemW [Clostridiaceae bacterium]|nr:radical SAM family heme chaperone HemW [Clostridiaceae bacterium]